MLNTMFCMKTLIQFLHVQHRLSLWLSFLVAIAVWSPGTLVQAQDALPGEVSEEIPGLSDELPGTPPVAVEQREVLEHQLTVMGLLRSGGWAMWPLGLFSFAVVALATFVMMILRRSEFCPESFSRELDAHAAGFELRTALAKAEDSPTYLGRMLARSLPYLDPEDEETLGRERVHEAMAEFGARNNGRYMSWVNYFSILAQAAPMLGLLGTVSGMIKAFSTMGREGMGDPSLLASNISEALVTTAVGLLIAVPALLFFFIFRNRLTQLVGLCVDVTDGFLDTALASLQSSGGGRHFLPDGLPSKAQGSRRGKASSASSGTDGRDIVSKP